MNANANTNVLDIKKEQRKKYATKKIECECGCEVSRSNMARHRRSKKHEKKMTKKLCDDEECPCVATPLDDSYEKCELCDGYYHPDEDFILIEEIYDEECCLCGRTGSIATGNLVKMKCSGDITCDTACDDWGNYDTTYDDWLAECGDVVGNNTSFEDWKASKKNE